MIINLGGKYMYLEKKIFVATWIWDKKKCNAKSET